MRVVFGIFSPLIWIALKVFDYSLHILHIDCVFGKYYMQYLTKLGVNLWVWAHFQRRVNTRSGLYLGVHFPCYTYWHSYDDNADAAAAADDDDDIFMFKKSRPNLAIHIP